MPAQPEDQPELQAPETRLPTPAGGRDLQLAALNAAWSRTRAGEPTLALVLAPAGLGKSWLTRSWVRSQQEHAQRPPASQAQTPGLPEAALWTVTAGPLLPGLLRAGLPTLRHERDPAFLAAAASLLPSPVWPVLAQTAALPADRGALWLTLWRVLERTALRLGGLCLLIEDLHASFPDDLEALRSLWARLQVSRAPILLLLTSRLEGGEEFWTSLRPEAQQGGASSLPGEGVDTDPAPALRRLHLGRLERGGLEALTAALLGSGSFPSALVAWLQGRCEGHPLHATELLRFLMVGDLLRDLGATWQFQPPPESAIPHGLEAVLTARLQSARQEGDLWQALLALALLERPLSAQDWAKVARLSPETLDWARGRSSWLGLIRSELVQGQHLHSLSHPLYAPLLRSMLTQPERQAGYARALGVARSPAERAAFARQCGHVQALPWTWEALSWAASLYAWDTAAQQARALIAHPDLDAAGFRRATEALAEALMYTSRFAEVIEALDAKRDALDGASGSGDSNSGGPDPDSFGPDGSNPDSPNTVQLRAYALARLGRDQEGYLFTNRHVGAHPEVRYYWTCFPMRLGLREVAWERLQGYLQDTRGEVSQRRVLALVSESWFLRIYQPWVLGRQVEIWAQARQMYRDLGRALPEQLPDEQLPIHELPADTPADQSALDNLYNDIWGMEYLALLGDWQAAWTVQNEVRALTSQFGDFDLRQNRLVAEGHLARLSGDFAAARSLLQEALRFSEAHQDPVHCSYAHFHLYCVAFSQGDVQAAAHHLAGFRATNAAMNHIRYDAPRELEIGWRQAALKRPGLVPEDALEAHLASAQGRDLLCAARLHLLAGQPERALEALAAWQPQRWQAASGPHGQECSQQEPPERLLLRGVALLNLGQVAQARAALEAGLAVCEELEAGHPGLGHPDLGRTGPGDPFRRELQAALTLLSGPGEAETEAIRQDPCLLFLARACLPEAAAGREAQPVLATAAGSVPRPRRFIRTLGQFGMEEDGQVRPWRARKLRELLALLLCASLREDGPAVPRARLCVALWPDADEQAAEQNFRTTLRRLRESLGDAAQIVRDAQGRYLLGQPRADVFMFLEAQARLDLEGAYGWYGGEFLPGLDLAEAEPLATMLRGRWRDLTLRLLGERGAAGGEALYRRLVADDPCDLEAVLVFVQGLTQAGQGEQAAAVLSRAVARFQAELGEVPPALALAQQTGRQNTVASNTVASNTVPLASPRS